LHIGGGPNDAGTKAPILAAIERHFDEIRLCYRRVKEPERGGSFGADLLIPLGGGHPVVRQTRTKLDGEGFVDCVTQALASVDFPAPKRATVVSYSMLFQLQSTAK